ncbi:MAG: ATP-binding protein [Spirochaetales bacterium]|jgi:uncharacterized protein|nr:ATP-binding protein [Spirochaetales bacterium]
MQRAIDKDLLDWKEKRHRKPLILRGARQVGKTTAIKALGDRFSNVVELNFEENTEFNSFFDENINPEKIVTDLENYLGTSIQAGETLLFFDEIQYCPRALLSLRYFYEKTPDLHVIAAGSLIEFELERISFPVGRVEFYYMYPLNYAEFVTALGKERLLSYQATGEEIPKAIHSELANLLRDYTIIGGMPEVVREYIENRDFNECQNIQSSIIETFIDDFPKYTKRINVKYISTVFNAVPLQLGRKLKYTNVSALYQSRELGQALELLEKAGLVNRIYHSSANGIPLEAEKNTRRFKAIFFDTGLALRLLRIPVKDMILNNDITLINEGAIAEQLAGQEIQSYTPIREKPKLYYWHREAKSSNAEVDYVIEQDNAIIPIEVKSGLGGTLRSLHMFIEEKKSEFGICLTQKKYSEYNHIQFMPLHSIGRIFNSGA